MLEERRYAYDARDGAATAARQLSETLPIRARACPPDRAWNHVRPRSADPGTASSYGAAHGTSATPEGSAAAADHSPRSPAQACSKGEGPCSEWVTDAR